MLHKSNNVLLEGEPLQFKQRKESHRHLETLKLRNTDLELKQVFSWLL